MIKVRNVLFLSLFILISFSSCTIWKAPYRVLKPNKNTVFSPIDSLLKIKEHIMSIDDRFLIQVVPNKAEQLIFPVEGENVGLMGDNAYRDITYNYVAGYRITPDSTVWLPGLGKVNIAGKTLSNAEILLKHEYSKIFNDPFVKITLLNKRAIIYSGGKTGTVVSLFEPNTNIIEFISTAGGIAATGKARKVYLFRKENDSYNTYKFDLSSADGIKYSRIIIQSNDIVYVEPRIMFASRLLEEISPYLGIITTTLLAINLFK